MVEWEIGPTLTVGEWHLYINVSINSFEGPSKHIKNCEKNIVNQILLYFRLIDIFVQPLSRK